MNTKRIDSPFMKSAVPAYWSFSRILNILVWPFLELRDMQRPFVVVGTRKRAYLKVQLRSAVLHISHANKY